MNPLFSVINREKKYVFSDKFLLFILFGLPITLWDFRMVRSFRIIFEKKRQNITEQHQLNSSSK